MQKHWTNTIKIRENTSGRKIDHLKLAEVAELVDAPALEAGVATRKSSSLFLGTKMNSYFCSLNAPTFL